MAFRLPPAIGNVGYSGFIGVGTGVATFRQAIARTATPGMQRAFSQSHMRAGNVAGQPQASRQQPAVIAQRGPGYDTTATRQVLEKAGPNQPTPLQQSTQGLPLALHNLKKRGYL